MGTHPYLFQETFVCLNFSFSIFKTRQYGPLQPSKLWNAWPEPTHQPRSTNAFLTRTTDVRRTQVVTSENMNPCVARTSRTVVSPEPTPGAKSVCRL